MRKFISIICAVALSVTAVVTAGAPATAATMTAKSLLGKLTVAAEAGSSTYERAKFTHWADADGDCQNARAEVLIAESKAKVTFTSSSHCTVATGKWVSWYDGVTWTNASDVDIDHLVPLKEAWESGARTWNAATRKAYANDLAFAPTLIAVTDNVNQSKGDRDPAAWLPAKNRCLYAQQWVRVKYRWNLTIDQAEKTTLASILTGSCGAQTVTVPTRATIVKEPTSSKVLIGWIASSCGGGGADMIKYVKASGWTETLARADASARKCGLFEAAYTYTGVSIGT